MIQNEFITKKQINIKVILKPDSDIVFFKNIFNYVSDYLNINVSYIDNFSIKNNSSNLRINNEEKVDYFFVDFIKKYEYIFAWNFYSKLHDLNKDFKLVLFKEQIENDDVKYFKNGVDDIMYTSDLYYTDKENKEKYLRWKLFALLRRRWDDSHSQLVLMRSGVIIDLIKRKVIINTKEVKITSKEFEVLSILIEEFNKKNNYTSKKKLFKKIYGVDNNDNSRVIDQLIFRLKNKFSEGFFDIDKHKGIKIN
ncbi:MAG: response regulator transcription factor [Mycoplasma sp.]|nr:response regulator transcription factor [Mycoplasma sp.]